MTDNERRDLLANRSYGKDSATTYYSARSYLDGFKAGWDEAKADSGTGYEHLIHEHAKEMKQRIALKQEKLDMNIERLEIMVRKLECCVGFILGSMRR